MKRIGEIILLGLIGLGLAACQPPQPDSNYTSFVNPFIGTGGHGHTYPGATMPFGMMQLSPDTRLDGWDGCSGYHYTDSYIYGFSHTHLSGTGVSDYGDVLLMPTTSVIFNNGADGLSGYRAPFSHENEKASPGYYAVRLDSVNIEVKLTVSERSGIHQYQFKKNSPQVVILDLVHRDKVIDSKINTIDNRHISGYRFSQAWAEKQMVFYDLEFSRAFSEMILLDNKDQGENVKAAFVFDPKESANLEIRIGISAVDEKGALANRKAEIGEQSFEAIRNTADRAWNKQLQKIDVRMNKKDDKINFYTSLYHTMIAPNLYQDVDGKYRGMDLDIHQTIDFNYYTVFSLWDTYRAAHPLYTILETKRTQDFINTFLAKYDEGGIMPIWDLSGNYTSCMIGYHAVPVIADAYLKGIRGFDQDKALEAMVHSATRNKLGLESYKTFGFIPMEFESESVSKTLEYAYDDWTIFKMAEKMDKTEIAENFLKRSQFYKNVFDPESRFMRGRLNNQWFGPFDPYEVNFNYTEANAWQYRFAVPQDINGLMDIMGGADQFERALDDLFSAKASTTGREQADITGLIGQYAHGNEPSHHMAYLYNFVNKPEKTQARVSEIMSKYYKNSPEGISGNEDCGQMGAWYVFSSLGFYPVTPGANTYIIGSPRIESANISLENGRHFKIETQKSSSSAVYIERVLYNDKALQSTEITHDMIMNGGTLRYVMTDKPVKWEAEAPSIMIKDKDFVAAPFIDKGEATFKRSTTITLGHIDPEAALFYSLNNDEYKKYDTPIELNDSADLKIYATLKGHQSATIASKLVKIDTNLSLSLSNPYANQYNAGGDNALIDGRRGGLDFRSGAWQGFHNTDLNATIVLNQAKTLSHINLSFLEDQKSWIFFPTHVEILLSQDGISFKSIGKETINNTSQNTTPRIKTISMSWAKQSVKAVKIIATNLGPLPEWHLGYPFDGRSWLFTDEIILN